MNIPGIGVDIGIFINLLLLCTLPIYLRGKYAIPKNVLYLFIYLVFDLVVSISVPIVYGTYDFSILQSKVNILVSVFNIYQIVLLLHLKTKNSIYLITKYLFIVLLIQSSIILISLLNTDIAQAVASLSKSSTSVERMFDLYGGARGLGWTNYSAFGLAIIFAVLILIAFFAFYKKYITIYSFLCVLFLSIIAGFSAGRTFFLGVFLGCIPLLKTKYSIFIVSITCLLVVISMTIDISKIDNNSILTLYQYSLEPLFNYLEKGEFTTTSTSYLIDKMYFPLTEKQILFGDGYYTDPISKFYYLNTDAGYMRFILYYGVFFSLGLYLCFLTFSCSVIKSLKGDAFGRYLIITFVISAFIFHYKGEVILFASGFNKIVLIYLIAFSFEKMQLIRIRP